MSETKTTKTSNDKRKAECFEALDYLEKGILRYIEENTFDGPQISTVFKVEVLERINLFAIRKLVPVEDNGDQQFIDWVNSKQFDATKIDDKKNEFGTVTCVGSNETGRLFSKEWIERMQQYDSAIRGELSSHMDKVPARSLILHAVYQAWINFTMKWTSNVEAEKVTPKGMTQKQHIQQLLAEKKQYEAELAALSK